MVIRVSGLTVTYNGSEPALRDVTLEFRKGEMVLLMGPNGAGKSTLIKAILGIVRPSAGRVEVLGSDPLKDRSVRRRIAYVPQVRSLNTLAPSGLETSSRWARCSLRKGPTPKAM